MNSKTSNNSYSASAYPKNFNRTYQAKGRIDDGKKWDHDGFDQLQTEHQSAYSRSSASSAKTGEKDLSQSTKTRREKRPDQQFYSVRQKQSMRQEELSKKTQSKIDGSERLNCSAIEKIEDPSPYLQPIKEVLTAFGEKEMLLLEDDKVSVSNVSTALSDPQEGVTKSEVLREGVNAIDISQSPKSTEPSDIIFDLALELGSEQVNVRIYQGEEDYEGVLDRICDENNVEFRTKLCLKINILLLIKESCSNPEKIDAVLNKLLDKNYELIMNDKQPDLNEERSCGYSDKETLMESTLEISESSF